MGTLKLWMKLATQFFTATQVKGFRKLKSRLINLCLRRNGDFDQFSFLVTDMGGWESGHQANTGANPSAFSLEEATYLYNQLITGKMNNEVKLILTLVALAKTRLG
jgi:hypothetical protein